MYHPTDSVLSPRVSAELDQISPFDLHMSAGITSENDTDFISEDFDAFILDQIFPDIS